MRGSVLGVRSGAQLIRPALGGAVSGEVADAADAADAAADASASGVKTAASCTEVAVPGVLACQIAAAAASAGICLRAHRRTGGMHQLAVLLASGAACWWQVPPASTAGGALSPK